MSKVKKVTIIEPGNHLGQLAILNGPLAIDEETLKKAEQAVAELTDEFIAIVGKQLPDLDEAIDVLADDKSGQTGQLDVIFRLAHVIKGLGGTFNYQLITEIANSLCRFIETLDDGMKPGVKEIMTLHLDGLHVVMTEDLTGDGGLRGRELSSGVVSVVAKFNEAELP